MFSFVQYRDGVSVQEASSILGQDLIDVDNILTAADGKDEQPSTKKIKHRETERQRRQEMSNLYASLRTLLPYEYIKGKRSVSDHMHEAVNYINYLEAQIKELRTQRDKLKTKSMSASDIFRTLKSDPVNTYFDHFITVCPCRDGLEVLISCGIDENKQGFPISKVLTQLMNTPGLNTVSCISSKFNDRFHYRIQCHVCDMTCVDLSELQQRLSNVI